MDLIILKKKIDGFRLGNGQLQKVPTELLYELRQAWENHTGPAEAFRRELGMKVGTLRKLLVESKKLNHVLASSDAIAMSSDEQEQIDAIEEPKVSCLELVYEGNAKVIRFPSVDILIDFLRKAV